LEKNVTEKRILVFMKTLGISAGLVEGQEEKKVPSPQAAQHTAEHDTVCGTVESNGYMFGSHTKPTS
jgi:hypothetical protein